MEEKTIAVLVRFIYSKRKKSGNSIISTGIWSANGTSIYF